MTDHQITDFPSFNYVSGGDRAFAGLYTFQQLASLVDLATMVACDFFMRPNFYKRIDRDPGQDPPLSELLAVLHARYGYDAKLPSNEQLDKVFLAIFGSGGVRSSPPAGLPTLEGDFPTLRDPFLEAVRAFVERPFNTPAVAFPGDDALRNAVRSHHRLLKAYIERVQGDSLRWSRDKALPVLTEELSYTILRSEGVSGVFGFSSAPADEWPYVEDGRGDNLVEAIWQHFVGSQHRVSNPLNGSRFSNYQEAGLRGAEALATVIDFQVGNPNNADLDLLIRKSYTWRSALMTTNAIAPGPPPGVTPPPSAMDGPPPPGLLPMPPVAARTADGVAAPTASPATVPSPTTLYGAAPYGPAQR
jgi:hypothetical protein